MCHLAPRAGVEPAQPGLGGGLRERERGPEGQPGGVPLIEVKLQPEPEGFPPTCAATVGAADQLDAGVGNTRPQLGEFIGCPTRSGPPGAGGYVPRRPNGEGGGERVAAEAAKFNGVEVSAGKLSAHSIHTQLLVVAPVAPLRSTHNQCTLRAN